ncbi:MAG: hypothetical protein JXA73_02660 [Acidobacteria bacterium]|nr:hypothetical protein [Acidobacteriota bacterium]
MTDQLLARIERLERQNKRMKAALSALCLFLGTLLTMAQTLPKKAGNSMDRLEVREIVLSDGATSAKLTPGSLTFNAKSGYEAEKAAITASSISLGGRYATEIKPTGLTCSRDGAPRFDLHVGEIGAQVALKNPSGLLGTMLDETTLVLINNSGMLSMRPEHLFLQKGEADALLSPSSLRIRDTDKYKAILGQVDPTTLKTGEARAGNAASLILSGKDDTVIWQAP